MELLEPVMELLKPEYWLPVRLTLGKRIKRGFRRWTLDLILRASLVRMLRNRLRGEEKR